LPDALRALHLKACAPIALIVDEAQHALTSVDGENAMAALKSARDQLNSPGSVNLMLVMSGSDRDKLLRLVNTTGAAFYGSRIQHMPELGADFIEHVAVLIEAQRQTLKPVDRALLREAFEFFGYTRQSFATAIDHALSPLAGRKTRFEQALVEAAKAQQQQDETQRQSAYLAWHFGQLNKRCSGVCSSRGRAFALTTPRRFDSTRVRCVQPLLPPRRRMRSRAYARGRPRWSGNRLEVNTQSMTPRCTAGTRNASPQARGPPRVKRTMHFMTRDWNVCAFLRWRRVRKQGVGSWRGTRLHWRARTQRGMARAQTGKSRN
jgi:hypothetical protein